jgi:hypothetical protein
MRQLKAKVKVKVIVRPADGQSTSLSWCQAPIFDPGPISFSFLKLILHGCGFVDVGRPLSRDEVSAVYSCCRASPA